MDASTDKQWRIDNAKRLTGLRLHRRPYRAWSDTWDHDHCAACWRKFAETDGPDIEREGYATGADYPRGEGYEWVCKKCFSDLMVEMQWTEISG
jgi:hypothetical protein